MNIERMLKLADVIEEHPDHFNIKVLYEDKNKQQHPTAGWSEFYQLMANADLTSCGTTACYAGWACHLWPAEVDRELDWVQAGAKLLDLPVDEAKCLFVAKVSDAREAATLLRDLVSGEATFEDVDDARQISYIPGSGVLSSLNPEGRLPPFHQAD
jgi:hypothetical protein